MSIEPYQYRITRNRAQCLKCFDIIESKHRWDCVRCKCEAIFIDGGKNYVRSGGDLDAINYLTEYGPYDEKIVEYPVYPDDYEQSLAAA